MGDRGIRFGARVLARLREAVPVETAGPRALRVPRHRPLGQSLVEFALVAPVMLLLTLTALDFGRIYLGWINLQSAVRAATNYAANNAEAWLTPSDPESVTTITAYRNQVINDTANTNCVLTPGVPADPTFADGNGDGTTTDIGDRATVALTCTFGVITPVISNILGSGINVSASAEFPVKTGQFATAVGSAPVASFTASPTSTTTGTQIAFTDTSSGSPTTWAWSFGDGATSSIQNPTHPYGTPGTYTVELTVTSAYGASTVTQTNYITINAPAPVADFTANITNPTVGDPVSFTDTSTGNPTAWEWTFGDGGSISGSANVAHTYNTPGTYSVTLKVTAASGSNTVTKTNYIVVSAGTCRVPTFNGTSSANAQTTWNTAGFTTTVQFKQGGLPWTIQSQDVVALSSAPCNTVITVSRN